MPEKLWKAVDAYLEECLLGADPVLDAAVQNARRAGLPSIAVSAPQGKLLMLLARSVGARRILEVGTLGGYSGIWLARALPEDGRLVTLELDPEHAEVAGANFAHAGLSEKVDLRVGAALELLPQVEADGLGPFDLFFLDADKEHNPDYFAWALKLSRPGSLIVVDNVVRDGDVIDTDSEDTGVRAARRLNELMANEPRVEATVIQTVGSKGYDGFALARVVD
jgi:predicted O-methyltransferase YrrM